MMNFLRRLLPSYRVITVINSYQGQTKKQLSNIDKKYEYLFWLSEKKENETIMDAKKRIFLNMPKAEGTLREIQIVNNYILQRIKYICDSNNIEFFLTGGNLIGAIRHHGFIPWDDDIDIGMMVNDYQRFSELIVDDEELSSHLYYGKVNGKALIKVKLKGYESFWVDIFLYDRYEATADSVLHRQKEIYSVSLAIQKESKKLAANYMKSQKINSILFSSPEFDEKMKSIIQKHSKKIEYYGHGDNICISILINSKFFHRTYPSCLFFPLKKDFVEFEGERYSCFNQFEQFLQLNYGDIWSLPNDIYPRHEYEIPEAKSELLSIKSQYPQLFGENNV